MKTGRPLAPSRAGRRGQGLSGPTGALLCQESAAKVLADLEYQLAAAREKHKEAGRLVAECSSLCIADELGGCCCRRAVAPLSNVAVAALSNVAVAAWPELGV